MALSGSDIERISTLARLVLTQREKDLYTVQLNAVLEHIATLNRLDTDDVVPTAVVADGASALREDACTGHLDRSALLGNAPAVDSGSFAVPKVI